MESCNIHDKSGWYASYEINEQGKALILCQQKKIKQLEDIIEKIIGETELCESPDNVSPLLLIDSIKTMLSNIPEVSHKEGYYIWKG